MYFAYLLKTRANVESFKVSYNIPHDVEISYCHEGYIEDHSLPYVIFFPLKSILEGGVRFPVDPLLLRTLSFYDLSPDQCLPNFYKDFGPDYYIFNIEENPQNLKEALTSPDTIFWKEVVNDEM